MHDPQGVADGPALVNTFDYLGPATEGYRWTTYSERLEAVGIEWAIYQDMADNYNDNPLAGFQQYRRAYKIARRFLSWWRKRLAHAPLMPW